MSSETQDRPVGKSRKAGLAANIREVAGKRLAVAEELDPRWEARVTAVERVLAEPSASEPGGYWRHMAEDVVKAADEALFGPVGEGVTSRG